MFSWKKLYKIYNVLSRYNYQIYFNTLEEARKTGLELLREFNCEVFIVRRIIKQGYYRTLGYFNNKNEYLR